MLFRKTAAVVCAGLAGASASALGASALERTYDVSHEFTVRPGGNLPPIVTGRAFANAWTRVTEPAGVTCESWDVFPFFANGLNPDFDPFGDTDLDCDDPVQGGAPLAQFEFFVGSDGFDGSFLAAASGCLPQFGLGVSEITIDPYDEPWDPGSEITGKIRSHGLARVEAIDAPNFTVLEAYAFSSAGYTVQGLNLAPNGEIEWLPEIKETVAGEAETSAQIRSYDPICYTASNTETGDSASGELLTSYWDVCDQAGAVTWQDDLLTFTGDCGEFEIDLTSPNVDPGGYYYFRVESGAVVDATATGVYAGLEPALGEAVPLAIPLPQLFDIEYDLTDVFDALLGAPSPAAASGGDPYDKIDLRLHFGDAAEQYAALSVGGGADPACPDLDGDAVVTSTDLNIVLSEFGNTSTKGDVNGDGVVDSLDLNAILGAFGEVCPPDDPIGACCFGAQCEQVSFAECMATGGTWGGAEVECLPGLCPGPVGACCFDGACAELDAEACQLEGGAYMGDGVPCADVDCPPGQVLGACCFGPECAVISEAECAAAGGVFNGPQSDCSSCQQDPTFGACCLPDGLCFDNASPDECSGSGGTFFPGLDCAQAACKPAGKGDCCAANGTPGCDQDGCQAAVCSLDPFCCDVAWDQICADLAQELCPSCAGD